MYPKNTVSPRPLQAKVVNAATGAPITTGVVAFHITGATRAAVAGTAAAHVANGLWTYTPTQAETNYNQFSIEFYHADAVADGPIVEVVTDTTSASILDDTGTTLPAQIAALDVAAGTGSNTVQFEITNATGGAVLENATVTLRLNGILKATGKTLATGRLSGNGLAVEETGTYALAVTCEGFNGHAEDLAVTAGVNTMQEIELSPLTITPPDNPTDCACAWVCLNDADAPVAGVIVRARPDTDATGDGYAWSGHTRSATSVAGTGLATINLPQGSKWWIRAGSGAEELYTVPATTTDLAGSIRGGQRDTY